MPLFETVERMPNIFRKDSIGGRIFNYSFLMLSSEQYDTGML